MTLLIQCKKAFHSFCV